MPYEKVLLVEGVDDKACVIGLMRNYVQWGGEPWPLYINDKGGVSDILKPALLSIQLKAQGVRTVGIMLDADTNPTGRYESIRQTSSKFLFNLPEKLPLQGVVSKNTGGMRFGVWIMPDNSSEGYLETFLRYLVPDKEEPIWKQAVQSTQDAKKIGSQCQDKDIPKANLYTWLAWQIVPGQSPGLALTKRILDPKAPYAEGFVKWFRELYEL